MNGSNSCCVVGNFPVVGLGQTETNRRLWSSVQCASGGLTSWTGRADHVSQMFFQVWVTSLVAATAADTMFRLRSVLGSAQVQEVLVNTE